MEIAEQVRDLQEPARNEIQICVINSDIAKGEVLISLSDHEYSSIFAKSGQSFDLKNGRSRTPETDSDMIKPRENDSEAIFYGKST